MNEFLGRLAPSPTGAQHLGNARTFLIAYWSMRKVGGRLLLRIEDIDSPRVKPWASRQAIEDLRWLGVDWDGEIVVQTDRIERYRECLNQLIEQNRVYPCTCTRKDIQEAASAPHESRFRGEGPAYPGTCSRWQVGDRLPDEGTFCWRFRLRDRELSFVDRVAGRVTGNPACELGDFPVTQKTGRPSYQLAVVVDDADSGVTEVVRGDDLIASTFRQIELYQAFGWSVPRFAHVPLVIGNDGRRLAKRHGDTRLSFYRESGVRPETIVGWAAHTSGQVEVERPTTAKEIVSQFSWDAFPKNRIVIDETDVQHWTDER